MTESWDIEKDNRVQSLADLSGLLFQYRKDPRYWIFRGATEKEGDKHLSQAVNLTPKVGRSDSRRELKGGGCLGYDPADEALVYRHFERAAPPYINFQPRDRLEWLAIARHHGVPTRLLDWTESLFVAAYFAVAETRGSADDPVPVIYATTNVEPAPHVIPDNLDQLSDVVLYQPPHITPRITAQRGVFTVHKRPNIPFAGSPLVRITLSTDRPITYKMNLHYAGINKATLFPGIDGLGEQLYWLHKWRALSPDMRAGNGP